MNIRFSFLLILSLCVSSKNRATTPLYTPKQKAVLLLKSVSEPVWESTAPHYDTDPLFKSHAMTNALPGLPAKTAFFFARTPRVIAVKELINPSAFDGTMLQPFVNYGHAVELQQHTAGIQIGQLWSHENLEMGWQWWFGAQERNWWLSGDQRKKYQETLTNYHGTITKTGTSAHAPQEPPHRLTLWHATQTSLGIGDVHLQAKYRIHPTNWFSCALGGYITVPVGTQVSKTTPKESDSTLPIETDELALRIINRARDVMLCTPLGKNGHLGIGFEADAQCFITPQLSLRGSMVQMHYQNGIENRYALLSSGALPPLEEGLPGSAEGISSNDTIINHLKNTLYPCEIKAEVKPGLMRLNTAGIHYENIPFHGALIYQRETIGAEYSESAPLATLTRSSSIKHQLNLIAGWRSTFSWGQSSTYATGHYIVSGTHVGGWGVALGITIQA